jgi:hypothetical protein
VLASDQEEGQVEPHRLSARPTGLLLDPEDQLRTVLHDFRITISARRVQSASHGFDLCTELLEIGALRRRKPGPRIETAIQPFRGLVKSGQKALHPLAGWETHRQGIR